MIGRHERRSHRRAGRETARPSRGACVRACVATRVLVSVRMGWVGDVVGVAGCVRR